MLLNLCFVIVRRLFSCGCKLLWILSQSRPAGCIHTEVQALWSSCQRHKPKLRIASGRPLLLGASTLSYQTTYVTSLQHCLKPLCCIVCGMKKRKVSLSCELLPAQGPRHNNPSPCPAPFLHEKCRQFLYTWNFHGLIRTCFGYQKTSLKRLCFSKGDLLSISLSVVPTEGTRNLPGFNSPSKCWLSDPLSEFVRH